MVEKKRRSKKVSRKRPKIEETLEEEDRIGGLPDCLILRILSLLPSTKDAIRTGTLSKRWKSLWTAIPTLIFEQESLALTIDDPRLLDFVSFVSTTLTQCCRTKLNKFQVLLRYHHELQSQVNNWIRYAVSRDVEELDINIVVMWGYQNCVLEEQNFFVNSCITVLRLGHVTFNPNGAISWKMLRILCISSVCVDEDLVENILMGSPVLETLEMNYCYGYKRLDITSKTMKNLVFCGHGRHLFDDAGIIEINAPNILSLKILGILSLWKILLVDVSSLVEAELDYAKPGYREKSQKEAKEDMLKGCIESLCHVKELKVGLSCAKALSRLEAKGFSFPPNMEFPDVTSSCLSDSSSDSGSIPRRDESWSDDFTGFEEHPSFDSDDY